MQGETRNNPRNVDDDLNQGTNGGRDTSEPGGGLPNDDTVEDDE